MGICLLYLFYSFRSTLPWTVCDDSWGLCYSAGDNTTLEEKGNATSSAELFYK